MSVAQDQILNALTIDAKIFELEHPAQYADIVNHFGDDQVIVGVQAALANDAAYLKLVAETDAEVSLANLATMLLPFFTKIIGTIIGGAAIGL
jgi:aconitase B